MMSEDWKLDGNERFKELGALANGAAKMRNRTRLTPSASASYTWIASRTVDGFCADDAKQLAEIDAVFVTQSLM